MQRRLFSLLAFSMLIGVGFLCRPSIFEHRAPEIIDNEATAPEIEQSTPHLEESSTARTPADAMSPAAPDEFLRIIVSASDDEPLPDAAIEYFERGENRVTLGETDQRGQLAVRRDELTTREVSWLICEKREFAAQTIVLPNPIPELVTIRLRPEAVIDGHVLLDDGTSAGAGITVACWPRGTEPLTYDAARESILSETNTRVVTTNHDGYFKIVGLEQHEHYSLGTGGRGLGAAHVTSGIRSGVSGLRIIVYQLHASALSFFDPEGRVRNLFCDGVVHPSFRSWSPSKCKLSIPKSNVALADSAEHLRAIPDDQYLQIWASNQYGRDLTGLRVECTIPGYAAVRHEYVATALERGVAQHVTRFVADGSSCGGVGVRFVQGTTPVEVGGVASDFAPKGKLVLGVPGGAVEWIGVLPTPGVDGVRRIDGFAQGAYLARVVGTESDFRSPSMEVTVSGDPSQLPIVDVSIDGLGALLVDYERRFPVSWGERPAIVLGSAGMPIVRNGVQGIVSRGMARFTNDRSIVTGVPSGDYLVFPFEISEGDSFAHTIQQPIRILPGALTTVWMPLTWP